MVGNDVVDLRDPETDPNTLHPRFDGRVFTPSERSWLSASPDISRARWTLWAAKEAAYKLARKLVPETIFSPVRFVVDFEPATPHGSGVEQRRDRRGLVRLGEREFAVRVTGARDWVHAVATRSGERGQRPLAGLARLEPVEACASRGVRELACDAIARRLRLAPGELEVRKRGRVPHLLVRGRPVALDLSLSHHGAFVAFACSWAGRPFVPGSEAIS